MSNPILNDKFVNRERVLDAEPMTVNGTIQLTAFLGLLMFAAAAFTWSRFALGYTDLVMILTNVGWGVGLILAFIIILLRVKYLVPVYALCEGCCLGGVSVWLESIYPGIVCRAVAGTFAAFFSMLILYRAKLIQCTDKFRSVISISTLSILGVYLINWIGSFFNFSVPFLNSSSPIGIGVCVVVVIVAALNLIIDFDFIEQGARQMLPKDMEWFGAFGLMVTLVWLYVEVLRLLALLQNRE